MEQELLSNKVGGFRKDEALKPMGIVSIITAGCVVVFWGLIFIWQKKRQVTQAKEYRLKYVQLLALLDQTTIRINDQSMKIQKLRDIRIIGYFESALKIFETLLEAMKHLPAFSLDSSQIRSAFILAEDCRDRIAKVDVGIKLVEEGQLVPDSFFELFQKVESPQKKLGCYFCSRPFVQNRFSIVRVRIESEVKQVSACAICKEELETTKKIKVLYFMQNGKPVHWSQVEDYTPMEDFWNLNKRSPMRKERHLELVTNQPTGGHREEKGDLT